MHHCNGIKKYTITFNEINFISTCDQSNEHSNAIRVNLGNGLIAWILKTASRYHFKISKKKKR